MLPRMAGCVSSVHWELRREPKEDYRNPGRKEVGLDYRVDDEIVCSRRVSTCCLSEGPEEAFQRYVNRDAQEPGTAPQAQAG